MTGTAATDTVTADRKAGRPAPPLRYLTLLTWAFTLFNTARIGAYLPTMWAIYRSADSSQHSLWTWGIWLGANTTMALWLYELNARLPSRAMVVNSCNALLCAATIVLIVCYR